MDNNPNPMPNPIPNPMPESTPPVPQSPLPNTPDQPIPPVPPAPAPIAPTPQPTMPSSAPMAPAPDSDSASPIAWIGIGLVAVAVIIYIVTCFTDYSLPLNIIKFVCALAGVAMAIVPAAIKKVKWLDWRVMSAILLGVFIAAITAISQTQHWIWEAKLKDAGFGDSSQTTEYKEPTTEDVLANEVNVVLGEFTVTDKGYYSEASLPVTITNKTNERRTFMIEIEATTPDGTRIMTDTVYANNLAPNQSVAEAAFDSIRETQLEQLKTATFKIIQAKSHTE